jgi:CSLREA domain-containing protein
MVSFKKYKNTRIILQRRKNMTTERTRPTSTFRYFFNILFVLGLLCSLAGPRSQVLAAPVGTFTVDSMLDTAPADDANPGNGSCLTSGGTCTLRAAIQEANASIGANTIIFAPGVSAIFVQSALPILNDTTGGTKIDGRTDYVNIAGTLAGATTDGFTINSNNNKLQALDIVDFGGNGIVINGDNNVIGTDGDGSNDAAEHNIIRESSKNGILVNSGAENNRISGNSIGLDRTGTKKANAFNGIQLNAANNRVGVLGDGISDELERNVISGNGLDGISISGGNNTVAGNDILANSQNGIYLVACIENVIGTNGDGLADLAEGNLISSNQDYGIYIYEANQTTIAGNRIGTNAAGTAQMRNMDGGIYLYDGYANVIGTDGSGAGATGEGNLISGNLGFGIKLYVSDGNSIAGNIIGTDLSGSVALPNSMGIFLDRSGSNIIGTNGDGVGDALERNIISGNTSLGIDLTGVGTIFNTIAGNLIGLNITGTAALPHEKSGVRLGGNANQNRVGTDGDGDSDTLERNTISGNTEYGINIENGLQNVIAGNYIGTNAAGTSVIGNGLYGVRVFGGSSNYIGTNGDGVGDSIEGNVISGNLWGGILLAYDAGNPTSANYIQKNLIGTNASGSGPLPNQGYGVRLERVEDNAIGWTSSTLGNKIAYNTAAGISFTSPVQMTGNRFLGNSMYGNGFGIDLGTSGVTYNDTSDGDTGPNGLLNFPILLGAESTGDSVGIAYELHSKPSQTYSLDFYVSNSCHSSGYGEGGVYLGYFSVTTDTTGGVIGAQGVLADNIPGLLYLTATTTDSEGSTSEFSECIVIEGPVIKVFLPMISR